MPRKAGDIEKHLKGVDYPARKEDLLQAAQSNDAPDNVLTEVRNLPQRLYDGPSDVMKAHTDKG